MAKKYLIVIIPICIAIAILTIFAKNYNPFYNGDGGLISGRTCSLPCFYNIYIGTSEETVNSVLIEQKLLKYCSSEKNQFNIWIKCGPDNIILDESSKIVKGIYYQLYEKVTVWQLIENYGSPEYIRVLDSSLIPEESSKYFVDLCYSKINTCIRTEMEKSTNSNGNVHYFEIKQNTLIDSVTVFSGTEYAEQKKIPGNQSWIGYGKYYFIEGIY